MQHIREGELRTLNGGGFAYDLGRVLRFIVISGLSGSKRSGFREGRAFAQIADIYGHHVFAETLDAMVSKDLSVDATVDWIAEGMREALGTQRAP